MSHKTVFSLLDARYWLVSIDRGDSLEGREKEIQACVRDNTWEPLDESLWEWEMDARDGSLDYAMDELAKEIHSKLGERFAEFDIKDYLDLHRTDIEEEIMDRDHSTFLDDLFRNTGDMVAFYSTGYSCGDTCFMGKADWNQTIREMRRALGIKGRGYDKQLDELLANAGYGGELVVYFTLDSSLTLNELVGSDVNTITFKYPHVALINTYNGSGHNVELKDHVFSLPFERENFYLDKAIKYNYTYAVCGMSSGWCNSTVVNLSKTKLHKRLGQSFIGSRQKQDDELEANFRKGNCTPGDMDMKRHRNIQYTNNGTCGSYCPKCSTFWVD